MKVCEQVIVNAVAPTIYNSYQNIWIEVQKQLIFDKKSQIYTVYEKDKSQLEAFRGRVSFDNQPAKLQ